MKDAYYFPHDSNAINDPKCSALIRDFGLEGYGFYWLLIELMHQQRNGKLEKFPKLYEGLAFQFKITTEAVTKQIEAMLHDYNLLQQDEKHIWSNRVLKNLEERRIKYELKANSGRIGGIKSGMARSKTKQNEAPLEANEQKERKGKEIKESKARPSNAQEVTDYAKSIGFTLNGQHFIDTYEKSGWVYGKSRLPVKDWKACVRTWKTNSLERNEPKKELEPWEQKQINHLKQLALNQK